ncbi:MAG: DNA-directed RNA polymerase subunit beta' [Patescibacteria group bacterium]|nr:DNA-directed RNA polymerase subunit beta' [Patescibacteria group bacterium]
MLNPIKTSDFDAIKLKLASPAEMLAWSHGEVTRPETINYRTQKAEKDGLFCERIFGPSRDWECYCGKYKKIRYKGIVCDKCGVEVTRSIVRRERFGHIKLETPCTHIWFLRGIASKIGLLLNLSMQSLEKVVYFASFIITDVNMDLKNATLEQIKGEFKEKKKSIVDEYNNQVKEIRNKKGKMMNEGDSAAAAELSLSKETDALAKVRDEKIDNLNKYFSESQRELKDLKPMLVVSEDIYQRLSLKYGHIFEAGIGAEAIVKILEKIDLSKTIDKLEKEFGDAVDSKQEKIIKRLKLLKSLRANDIRPEWMVLSIVPVIPPDLRPMVSLEGGRFATSDLNDLYRRVINRNNRLKQLIELAAPEVICRNEKRMLQEAVDALIDNSARASKTTIASTGQKRQLKSLADSLKGKQGRFRQNLLGKRTDYSGRSVIVVNPKLNLDQCGLPKRMALELFKPFIISKLIEREIVHNVRSASRHIDAGPDEVWDILEDIVKKSYVLLNRAPTLHRLGIQAFKPILIEGKAIQIHPLVCTAFNADFDGDQMAVHVPLTEEAKAEARDLMLASHNLLKPATGDPIVTPNQDIVWGAYYITNTAEKLEDQAGKKLLYFYNENEAKTANEYGQIKLQDFIKVKINGEMLITTVGRILFNEVLPEKLRFMNKVIKKGDLKQVVKDCLRYYGEEETVKFVDNLKNRAFELITKSGLSFGMGDLPHFADVDKLIAGADIKVDEIKSQYEEGLLTDSERSSKTIELWSDVKEDIMDVCKKQLPPSSSVYSMIDSGARGSWAQLTQILGMKGLVTSPSGGIIELPVKGNFKKGFDVLEYFISTHGVRKGLSDTALRTANAGYLTRRLVDVAQDVIVSEEDCGDAEGIVITKKESEEMGESLIKRIGGRYLAKDLKDKNGKVILKKGELLTEDIIEEIKDKEIEEACIRTVLSCRLPRGICAHCYGFDLARNKTVEVGVPVGVIAAQSIGEPGTQLTMRTFHTGGVAGGSDITQGLPRVEEIFENRTPKKKAIISDVDGKVKIEAEQKTIKDENGKEMLVSNARVKILKIYYKGDVTEKYRLAAANDEGAEEKDAMKILVKEGDEVKAGDPLYSLGKKTITARESGKVIITPKHIKVVRETEKVEEMIIPKGTTLLIKDGDEVKRGQQLTDGSLDLDQLFRLQGRLAVQKYIIKEIQYVYSSQGQPLNDKHVEIIAHQMFSRFLITEAGKSDLLPGEVVEESVIARLDEDVRKSIKAERLLSGITKASLTTESFLSSASFQETARVLIDAALSGKIDYLEGLKENVIIGCLIPAGTGYKGRKKRAKY